MKPRSQHRRKMFHDKTDCAGKYRYKDARQAQFEIDRAFLHRAEVLRMYDCLQCGKIHLTAMTIEDYQKRR